MNIDEKIKQQLAQENAELDALLNEREGLFEMVWQSFRGSLKIWVILVNVFVLLFTALLFWTGYQFFVAEQNNQLFWGICFLASLCIQIALKMWLFMEMNRTSLIREVKRLELTVEQLKEKLIKT